MPNRDLELLRKAQVVRRLPQRFDYFLRTRPATDEELARVARDVAGQIVAADEPATILDNPLSYPQREAVLYALRELAGGNAQETRDR